MDQNNTPNEEMPLEGVGDSMATQAEASVSGQNKVSVGAIALIVIILAIVAGAFFFLPGEIQKLSVNNFGIPQGGDNVVLIDGGTLHLYDSRNGETEALGSFSYDGTLVGDVDAAAISPDLSIIALSIPSARGSEVVVFDSFENGKLLINVENGTNEIAVSNDGDIVFIDPEAGAVFTDSRGKTESLGNGTTPFFMDGEQVSVVGTDDGFRMYDILHKDSLETETPTVPIAQVVKPSRSGERVALVSDGGSVHVYKVLSARPFSMSELAFLVAPTGTYDAVTLDDKYVAYLAEIEGNTVLSVYDLSSNSFESSVLELQAAALLSWTQ